MKEVSPTKRAMIQTTTMTLSGEHGTPMLSELGKRTIVAHQEFMEPHFPDVESAAPKNYTIVEDPDEDLGHDFRQLDKDELLNPVIETKKQSKQDTVPTPQPLSVAQKTHGAAFLKKQFEALSKKVKTEQQENKARLERIKLNEIDDKDPLDAKVIRSIFNG